MHPHDDAFIHVVFHPLLVGAGSRAIRMQRNGHDRDHNGAVFQGLVVWAFFRVDVNPRHDLEIHWKRLAGVFCDDDDCDFKHRVSLAGFGVVVLADVDRSDLTKPLRGGEPSAGVFCEDFFKVFWSDDCVFDRVGHSFEELVGDAFVRFDVGGGERNEVGERNEIHERVIRSFWDDDDCVLDRVGDSLEELVVAFVRFGVGRCRLNEVGERTEVHERFTRYFGDGDDCVLNRVGDPLEELVIRVVAVCFDNGRCRYRPEVNGSRVGQRKQGAGIFWEDGDSDDYDDD